MKILPFVFLFLFFQACSSSSEEAPEASPTMSIQQIDTILVDQSIRALQGIDDQQAWFAGSGGIYGYTKDGGNTWKIDSIVSSGENPHFRAIGITKEAAHLLTIGSPAKLYRSTDEGQSWSIVYQEDHPQVFYDAMTFWDDQFGIAMGDPTDGCLSVIRTEDGGNTWQKVDCASLPSSEAGEAAFAASNTNLAVGADGRVWMVSGGQRARVFYSLDYGKTWEVADTPIIEGGQMTGIYSVDFFDDQTGVIYGGDWNNKASNQKNKAISRDGGKSWSLLADGQGPGFRSCVRFFPDKEGKGLLAIGSPGISASVDAGQSWQSLSDSGFYTFDFGKSATVVWVAGAQKVGKIVLQGG